ncbi:phage major capsid protein [Proteus mirabilis]
MRSWMRRQIKNSKNVNISMAEVAGKKVVSFDEIPVRRVDAILTTEDQVK